MKKKLFFVLMICMLAAVVAATLAGCKGDKLPSVRNLNVTDDGYLAWGAVDGADGYVIYFNDDESDRFFVTDNYISIDEPEIRSVLKSGEKNNVYIRAVTLNDKKLPDKSSDRSKIIFNYSRKLATPNKIKMNKERFSWRGVTDAEDYKAYVRRAGESTGTLYDMTWSTGTASVTGTINDLPDGSMYYVSIVATAKGYESSDPSDAVPYDRTIVNVGELTYTAYAGSVAYGMSVDFEDANLMVATVTADKDSALRVLDSTGKEYTVATATAPNAGDYVLTLNTNSGNVTVSAIASYYIYVNGDSGTKLFYNAETDVYVVNVTLKDGDNYVIKNGAGELITTYTDSSVNQGSSVTAGEYSIKITTKDEQTSVSVSAGTATDTGNSTPASRDGQWAVTFDYNYEGAPAALVVYATDNRPVATPAEPLRAGYIFNGWYADAYCLIEAAFGKKQSNFAITCPTTLYAKWTKDSTAVVEHTTHEDKNGDGKCDVCGKTIEVVCTNHVDANADGKCDVCGATVSTNPNKCNKHIDRDGDGKCDNCGAVIESSVPTDTKGTIYFDISAKEVAWFASDGAVINVHIWYADGTNNGFPGPKMTYNATLGYYEAEYYTSRTVKGVLFTRNNPNTNPQEGEATEWNRVEITDFTFDSSRPVYHLSSYFHNAETGYTAVTGKWIKVGEAVSVQPGDGRIYVDFRDISWFLEASADIRAYIWYADGSENAAYPGKAVTYTTDASSKRYAAYVDYYTNRTVAGVIFTRNSPEGDEWNKIELTGDAFFDPAKPAYHVTALGTSFEGYWESEEAALESPTDYGNFEDEDGDKTTYFYLNMNAITWFGNDDPAIKALIVYSDNTVNTKGGAAATMEGDLYKWGYNGAKTIKSITILRYKGDGSELWNSFDVELSDDVTKNVVVVHGIDADNAQYTYVDKDAAEVPVVTRTVYFTDNYNWGGDNGGKIYVYVFKAATQSYMAKWPGNLASYSYNNEQQQAVYSFTFPTEYDTIIFSNGAGKQTVDITLGEHNGYFLTGDGNAEKITVDTWDKAEEPSPEKTLSSISAVYAGGNVTVGNDPAKSDITVTATYSDASTAPVAAADYTLSGYDKTAAGAQTVTVTYEGKNATFSVTYVAAASWEASETKRTVYFSNNQNDSDVYAYVWVGDGADKHEYKAWDDKDMATYVTTNGYGQKVWSYTFSVSYENIIFVFGDQQTVDVALSSLTGDNDSVYPSEKTDGKWTVGQWKYE